MAIASVGKMFCVWNQSLNEKYATYLNSNANVAVSFIDYANVALAKQKARKNQKQQKKTKKTSLTHYGQV